MPKKRQIPRLFDRKLADGTIIYDWKPSGTLRKAGFVTAVLGTDEAVAIAQALEHNRNVASWQASAAGPPPADGVRAVIVPRVVRFGELVNRYRASDAFTDLRDKTQLNYETRLRQLTSWAFDGQLAVRDIDRAVVRDLRNALVGNSSPWTAGSTLRVLRLLLEWARREGIIAVNPATDADIPEAPSRRTRMDLPARAAIREAADALGLADVAFAVELAFWMIQRQADVLALARFGWRELRSVDPRHAAVLANEKGRVMGFRLAQQKTGTWVDAPVPPHLHDLVEARLRASPHGLLLPDPDHPAEPLPGWKFGRRFREAQDAAWAVALMDGDEELAAAIDACQFRDLRRTGMVYYGDSGAQLQWITALSGHAVLGKRTIIDTYMPGDTAGACACVATGVRAMQTLAEREATG